MSIENSQEILHEVKIMLKKNNIFFDRLIHFEMIHQRAEGKRFSMAEHIRAMIYSQLSNNRPWRKIEKSMNRIDQIFFGYDKNSILNNSADYFIKEIQSIKCGNQNVRKQMNALHGNIRQLEKIEKEFGSLDRFVTSGTPIEIVDLLANSIKYKLQTLGLALAMEYLRNIGVDGVKPDTHIRRILGSKRLGFSSAEYAGVLETVEIIDEMATRTECSKSEIDAIFWFLCSDDNAMICTSRPECKRCSLNGKYCNFSSLIADNILT